eukprot:CAMPEP_0178455140 /NCGR_PEP_ID=MMETSP0689_2-20121128/45744_1 /TAXON_ID=160604 /ORGANISM="Amphidinium massartii, Strain CS-259" /LENGTH=97 /DNA_ID=CAMNT_0020081143 /DNA_START=197 /DNA_END=487 /DNA_ORIENTATION=+
MTRRLLVRSFSKIVSASCTPSTESTVSLNEKAPAGPAPELSKMTHNVGLLQTIHSTFSSLSPDPQSTLECRGGQLQPQHILESHMSTEKGMLLHTED